MVRERRVSALKQTNIAGKGFSPDGIHFSTLRCSPLVAQGAEATVTGKRGPIRRVAFLVNS
jgi:hypothetical protein